MNCLEMKRREFLKSTATFGFAAASGLLCRQAFAAQTVDMRVGATDLRLQPVLMYGLTKPQAGGRSWRPWGDVQTEEAVADELKRIDHELKRLASGAEFGMSVLATAKVNARAQAEALKEANADVLLVYASGGWTDLLEALAGLGKPMILFVRNKSGPYYLWHEIVDSRFLRRHTDAVKQTNAGLEDVVVDDQGEILWRLRALYGLKNTVGRRILCIGGPGGWACPQAPERARERFQLDMVTIPIPEVNALIESARQDATVERCRQEAKDYMEARGVDSEITQEAVAQAFLLKSVFRDLMQKHEACAVTTNACMNSYAGIMPCLTLTLTNDDGYMAYCESDFVNIPAGILMHYIAGRPTYFCNPTIPQNGRMLFAHCTAPRRMNGHKLEPVTLVTHYESDHGAATHVHFPRGQQVTVIKPDFEAKHWLALTGKITDNPVVSTCRAQIEVALDADTQDVIRNMRGFHCQIAYGDWTREVGYAAKKVGIEVQRLQRAG